MRSNDFVFCIKMEWSMAYIWAYVLRLTASLEMFYPILTNYVRSDYVLVDCVLVDRVLIDCSNWQLSNPLCSHHVQALDSGLD